MYCNGFYCCGDMRSIVFSSQPCGIVWLNNRFWYAAGSSASLSYIVESLKTPSVLSYSESFPHRQVEFWFVQLLFEAETSAKKYRSKEPLFYNLNWRLLVGQQQQWWAAQFIFMAISAQLRPQQLKNFTWTHDGQQRDKIISFWTGAVVPKNRHPHHGCTTLV
jgi:hypothetical protein